MIDLRKALALVTDIAEAQTARRARLREVAVMIVDDIVAIRGDDARDRRIDRMTSFVEALIDSAAAGGARRVLREIGMPVEDERTP